MSENHLHYFPKNLSEHEIAILKRQASEYNFTGPVFIGQGLSEQVGSDCYGYYIVASKQIGKKTIWGIARADSVMHKDWVDGHEDCSIDMEKAKPTKWIIARGKNKNGSDKWWFCDEFGKRYTGRYAKTNYGWNGAYEYMDPSF